jgi:hypothetical protein
MTPIAAFAHLCAARMDLAGDYIVLTVEGRDELLHAELLNYILALSSQALLQ